MNFIDDLPFYLVVLCVLINILLGISAGTELTVLMIRSIVVTIILTALGLLLSSSLKDAREAFIKAKEEKNKQIKAASTIDIKIPPDSEEVLINYTKNDYDDDEFQEINPAFLHNTIEDE
ncbi:MAG: hypothetical protein ACOZCL_04915 [Bacillota bacterium]